MGTSRNFIRFLLNGVQTELSDVSPNKTLLDYLRLNRRLTGTKEGCAEGDCGACTVLVGRLSEDGLIYETVNACIRFLASLDGCHVVTIEYLTDGKGGLHPVQEAMVLEHGSQCGFCTPGIVMSLYALWMEAPNPNQEAVERALQGNLCRCTGYAPIVRAAMSIAGDPKNDPLNKERSTVEAALTEMNQPERVELTSKDGKVILPKDLDDLVQVLDAAPDATLIAGATDVGLWVTKFMRPISPVVHLGHLRELQQLETKDNMLVIGAGVTYSGFDRILQEHFPQLDGFWSRIGGWQVRNMGTIGGNIANGSPIGDTPSMLIALGATVTLRSAKSSRSVMLEDFFIEYGKQDIRPGEFVEAIHIPLPDSRDIFEVHKISKRRDEDISSVCGAFWIKRDGDQIDDARIAFGGMAGIPKRAHSVEQKLIGQSWTEETVVRAQDCFAKDFEPITDARASAKYRALVCRNLLMRVYQSTLAKQEEVA